MKFIKSNLNRHILVLIFLSLIKIIKSQNIEELIKSICDYNTIKYSIFANLEEYLQFQNNIDGKEMFESLEIFQSKKLGTISETYYNKTIFKSVKEYDTYPQLLGDLRTSKIDGVIQPDKYAEDLIFFSDDLALFPDPIQINEIGFGIQENNIKLVEQINKFIKNNYDYHESRILFWSQLNFDEKYIDTKLTGENGTLNVVIRFENYPYSYKKNNEIMGSEIELLYLFAKEYGYELNLKEVNTYEEQVESLKSKSANISAGYFIIKDNIRNEITFSDIIYKSKVYIIVRYSNLPESTKFKAPHDSVNQFNGENLGALMDSSYVPLTLKYFPKTKYIGYETFSELYYHLLMKNIEGFIIDEILSKYFQIIFTNKLSFYPIDNEESHLAFAFQKNQNGIALLNEFNEFLSTLNLEEIINKWLVIDTSKIIIDKNLNNNAKKINAAFNFLSKPLSFIEEGEEKGYDIEILYKFAKAKNYNINLIRASLEERQTFIEKGIADISGGAMTITDERKERVYFSNPVYITSIGLIVRTDSKKDMIKIKIKDKNYKEKSDNNAELKVKFSDSIKTSSCIFPDTYNETILINCTISNLNKINASKGFKYDSTSDKINILYNNLELNNFFQANSKIIGHNNIIIESNKDNIMCFSSTTWKNGSFIASIIIIIFLLFVLFFSRYL